MSMKKYTTLLALLLIGVLTGYCQQSAYLFVYFTGNKMSEEAIRMGVSLDGYNYKALNGNRPILDSRVISSTGGVRDPISYVVRMARHSIWWLPTWYPGTDGIPIVPWYC